MTVAIDRKIILYTISTATYLTKKMQDARKIYLETRNPPIGGAGKKPHH